MTARRARAYRITPAVWVVAVALGVAACGGTGASRPPSAGAPSASSATEPSTTDPAVASAPGPTTTEPLSAPRTSAAQDGQFLTEVTEADPRLATYEQQQGNVALRALLTDGSAFCALLGRGGGVDNALVDVAVGARSDESQTHLPLSVRTFNTVEAVALLTLCPSSQRLLPAADRAKIRALGATLAREPAGH